MVDRLVGTEVNAVRIANVEQCFGAGGKALAVPGRVLVGEGRLLKVCRKKPKRRQFFLFNDILVYGNIIVAKKKYNKQHVIALEDVCLQDVPDTPALSNGWLIRTPRKSFAVYAATATEKREWMEHIGRCVDELLAKTGKQRPTATQLAAVWVPDGGATKCMVCDKTEFTLISRRHHCRKCGAVACNACTNYRFLLPEVDHKPVRVCSPCFGQLTGSGGDHLPQHKCSVGDDKDSSDSDGDAAADHRVSRIFIRVRPGEKTVRM